MRLRTAHLAFVMLLLSSLGAVDGSAMRSSHAGVTAQVIAVLLQQAVPARRAQASSHDTTAARPAHGAAPETAAWTMRPPAAHAAHRQAVSASLA